MNRISGETIFVTAEHEARICYSAHERRLGSFGGYQASRQKFYVPELDSAGHFVLIGCFEGK
jgi:hypothetical protein